MRQAWLLLVTVISAMSAEPNYREAENLLAARQALEDSETAQPDSARSVKTMVNEALRAGDAEEAKRLLRSAAKRFPQDGQLHAELARALTDRKLFDLALSEWLRAQQAGELDADSLVTLAALEYLLGAYADSVRHSLAVESRPNVPAMVRGAAAFVAGRSYEAADQREEAVRHLKRAIELDPLREESYLMLASAFEKTGEYGAAAEVLEQRQKNIRDAKPMPLELGSDLIWAGRYEEGARLLEQVTEKSPDAYDAYARLGLAYNRLGQPDRQVRVLQELTKRKPDYPMGHIMMVMALLNQDPINYPRVLDELAEAQALTPEDPDIYYLRGKVFVATGRYGDAINELRHSIELRPVGETAPYYLLGLTYRRIGRADLSAEVLERMKHLKPELVEAPR
jgi:tetratricopeptide (TPR) repeat protein